MSLEPGGIRHQRLTGTSQRAEGPGQGFQWFDNVLREGEEGFVFGRRTSGDFDIMGSHIISNGVTGGFYSTDNHNTALGLCESGLWVAWDAYERAGSRSFARFYDGEKLGEITPLNTTDNIQVAPSCTGTGAGVVFFWFEKVGKAYSIWTREYDGSSFSPPRLLHELPARVKPAGLQSAVDRTGSIWAVWQQGEAGRSTIGILRSSGEDVSVDRITAGTDFNYRPKVTDFARGGIYVVWDAYSSGYDVYGCFIDGDCSPEPVRISRDSGWETRPTICRNEEGRLWCAWVRCKDAMWRQSVIHQKYSVRGAVFNGGEWKPLASNDGSPDIALLHYGLLTDFNRKRPALGHQGRRLRPVIKAGEDNSIWIFYETKADDSAQTIDSKGRLVGRHFSGRKWTEPLNVSEGNVFYELAAGDNVGTKLRLISRNIAGQPEGNNDVDELYIEQANLSDAVALPKSKYEVDLNGWEEIDLPLPSLLLNGGKRNRLVSADKDTYQLIWGDFHVHSSGSVECEGDPDELAHYARDKSCIQALTISDNDCFRSKAGRGNQRWQSDHEWDMNLANSAALNESGRFALFPGYEQTIGGAHRQRLLRNHSSVMADDDEMERDQLHFDTATRAAESNCLRKSNKDIVDCVAWAERKSYFPLPHAHNNWWRIVDPSIQRVCDVTTAWMRNIENFDIYTKHLDEGVKFGFTGSSDSHYRNPGLGGAVTGLWVREISREAVLEALRERRVYATAGSRILVEFAVNESFMGETVVVHEDPVLQWRVEGEEGVSYRIILKRDGKPFHEAEFTGSTQGEKLDEKLITFRTGKHYYSLEVIASAGIPDYGSNAAHALGGRAWSSPVWVETADWIIR